MVDHGTGRRASETLQRGQIGDRLQQVRLTGPIIASK
jgi:hypothetical protein